MAVHEVEQRRGSSMTTQSTSAARLYRVILVAVVALLASAGALTVATDSKGILVNSETSHYGFGVDEAKRRLRSRIQSATHEANEFENRAFDFKAPSVSGILNKLSKNPSNEIEAENLFVKLNLASERSKLFESPQFQTWSTRVVKGYKQNSEAAEVAIAGTLTRRLGDEALAKLIVAAQDVSSTKTMAAKLAEAQMKNWLSKERSADYVFQTLRLDKETFGLLWNPLLGTWVSYANKLKEKPYEILFAKLKTQFGGDQAIANMVASAKRQESVEPSIVKNLEKLLFDAWIANRQTGDDIFTHLNLHDRPSRLFDSPQLGTWVSYVTKLDRDGADEQIYTTLRKYYGDHDIAMNLAGSKTYLKADVAQRLEELLHKSWVGEATSAKELFARLKLDSQGDKLFESPVFSTWVSYVTKLDTQNADDVVLSTLKTSYTDYALAKLLVEARTNDDMKVLADKLVEAQRKNWLNDGKSADDVFKLLKLDDEADNLLKSPMLSNWMAYVKQLKENPYAILLEKLKAKFSDSDSKFADMLMEAKKDASTSTIAGKIEAEQLEKWLNDGKTASGVFKLLKLEEKGVLLLWYRRVRMWVAYASKVDPKNSDELTASVLKAHNNDKALGEMISVGRNHDEEMTVKFQEVVLNMWLREKKSADDVFDYVLKRHGQHILTISRDLNTWAAYVTKLGKEDAYKTMIAVLKRQYDEKALTRMLDNAQEISGSELIVKKLQQEL